VRDVLLVLHIVGVAAWLGASVTQFVANGPFIQAGGSVAVAWLRTQDRLGRVLYPPAAVLVLLTGIGLVLDSDVYGFGSVFVTIGFAVVVISAVLGTVVFGPRYTKAAEAIEAGDDAGGRAIATTAMPAAYIDVALLIVTIAAMVGKWGR
jgi:uncharacterized membrane protein